MIFEMSTPGYHLRTSGVRHRITPSDWSGPAVARAVHEALDIARTCSSDATTADGAPLVVGAIPFDTSTPAVLYVPERAQWRDPTTATTADQTIRPTPADAPESFPPPDSPAYRRAVGQAVYEINVGHLDKVVLARRMTVEHAHPVDRDALFAHLAADNPQAFTYRVDLPGSSTFLGASPELVLRCQDGVATSVPLAGSAPRCPVTAPDHELINHRRRRQLLHSPKNLQEHSLVSRRVAEGLPRPCRGGDGPHRPRGRGDPGDHASCLDDHRPTARGHLPGGAGLCPAPDTGGVRVADAAGRGADQ